MAGWPLSMKARPRKRATLHGIPEGAAAIAGLGNFLELANGFFEEPHFTKKRCPGCNGFRGLRPRAHLTQFRREIRQKLP